MEDYLAADRAREPRDPGCRAREDRYVLRAGAAEGSRRLARVGRVRARAVRLRQESRRRLGDGLRPLARARRRCVLPPGLRRAAGQARRRHAGADAHAGAADDSRRAIRSRSRPRAAASWRAPRSSPCRPACCAADKIKFTPDAAEAPDRRASRSSRSAATTTSRWSSQGNPLQLQQRRSGVREGEGARAPPRCSPTCPARRCAWSRSRGKFGARAVTGGRGRDGGLRDRLARRPVRRRHQEGDRQDACDALERPSRGRSARSRPRPPAASGAAQGADGAGARAAVLRRRGRARDAVGYGRRRLGVGRARRRGGAQAVGRRR